MAKAARIQPDLQFVKSLQAVGGDTLKKCYQCATCSVACPISPADGPFPRKEMIWAQWGLKDKLVNDIDIWLCHNCGQCSELCPRGAKPADVLSALRNMAYRDLMGPRIIGKWMSSGAYLPILVAIPAALWLFVWWLTTGLTIPEGEIVFGKVFPGDFTIDPIFTLTFLFMVTTFAVGVVKLVSAFNAQGGVYHVGPFEKPNVVKAIWDVITDEVLTHRKWKDCGETTEADKDKFKGHLFLFYSFIALAIVTGTVAFGHWGGKVIDFIYPLGHTPLHLYHPIKILANAGAIGLLIGLTLLTRRRMNLNQAKAVSSFYDWYLLGIIWAIALTGLFTELLRLAGVATLAYPMYYVHLIAVWMLFAYLPWSKLGHLVYRTVALVYARRTGRVPMA
jgi:quinone-modifying oxidoreductase subunit QmoC